MGKKKSGGGGAENKADADTGGGGGGGGENKTASGNGGGGEKKKNDAILTVVLKLDMHCEGCATKIMRAVRSMEGVEVVKGGDGELTKLTVIGKVDPAKLRESVEKKAKKKVELISPAPPKKENKENNNGNGTNGGAGAEKKGKGAGVDNDNKKAEKKGEDNKKAKEPPVTTAVMKLNLHCQGCIQKIRKIVTKTKGYLDMSIDEGKSQITVKGAMDMKSLAHTLAQKLRKSVEIVPPKKEAEKKENDGGKGKGGGGDKGREDNGREEGEKLIQYVQHGYPNPAVFGYGYWYPYAVEQSHASQMFSDENPNACSVM